MFSAQLPRIFAVTAFLFNLEVAFSDSTSHVNDPLDGPRFIEEPPSRLDFSNSTGTRLECRAQGSPPLTVTWNLLDGAPVSNISGLRHVSRDGALVFSPFRSEQFRPDIHTVSYRCVATNPVGTVISRDTQVKAVLTVDYDVHVYDAFSIRGNTAVFKCHIPTFLEAYVAVASWIRDDTLKIVTTSETDGKFWVSPTGDLFVKDVTSSDKGSSYRCQTYHRLTKESKTSSRAGQLIVTDPRGNVPPKILDSSSSSKVSKGSAAFLPCVAQGFPSPTTVWLRRSESGEVSLVSNGRTKVVAHGLLVSGSQETDSGIYICRVNSSTWTTTKEFTLNVQAPIRAQVEPSRTTLNVGEPLVLNCQVSGHHISSVTWMKDGQPVSSERTRYDEAHRVSTLSLPAIRSEDKGMYQCFAHNDRNVIQSAAQVVLGDFLPEFKQVFEEHSKDPGAAFTLHCVAVGNPAPSILWTLDTIVQKPSGHVSIKEEVDGRGGIRSTLHVRRARKEDGGQYSCEARNRLGKLKHSARVNIHGSLEVRAVPPITAVAGEDMRMSCPVFGSPIDSVEWKKDTFTLPKTVRQKVFSNGTLLISMIQRGVDGGEYLCTARNAKGEFAQAKMQVDVLVPPKILPFAFQDELLREGMRARLQCVVSEGDSPVTIEWLKDGQAVGEDMGIIVKAMDEFSSILAIKLITPRHNGLYTCVAQNAAGAASHSARLSVNVAPKIVPFSFGGDHYIAGVLARVSCVVYQGDLPLVIEWLKDGRQILPESGSVIRTMDDFTSVLTIDSIQSKHSGNYTCVARNAAAAASHTAQLVVKVPPKIVPFSFQDEQLTEGMFVRVSCVISRGDLPLNITWLKNGGAIPADLGIAIRNLDDHSSGLSLDNLASRHSGNYTCLARNAAASATFTAPLLVNVPPRWIHFPAQVVSVVLNQDVVLHCEADGFPAPKVVWMKGENDVISDASMQIFPNGTLLVSNVQEEQEGYYVCKASNGIGAGLDHIVHLKVYDPPVIINEPNTVMARVGQTAALSCVAKGDLPLNVTWMMDGKLVSSQFPNRYKVIDSMASAGLTSELTVKSIEKQDGVVFTCWVQNAYGEDQKDFTLLVQSRPDAPVGLTIADIGNQSARVSWNEPFDGNDKIRTYIVEYKQMEGTRGGRAQNKTVSGDLRFETISGLKPSVTYSFRMFAENNLGKSGGTEPVVLTITGEAPSGAPSNVNVQALDSQTVKVSWQPPPRDSWNGDIRGYYVGYRPASSSEQYNFQLLEVPAGYDKGLSFTIPSLQEFTKYTIAIQAFNDIGKGPLSDEILVMTSEDVPSKSPTDVRCSAQSSSKIAVSWQPPSSDSINGILRGHRVLFWPVDSWDGKRVGLVNSTFSTAALESLEPFTNHSIQVVAYTLAGDGVPSKPIYCRTWEDVPGSPAEIKCVSASTESVAAYWLPPQNSNGHIIHYTIYVEDPTNGKQTNHKVLGHLSHFEVKGLKRSLRYKLWVTASSVLGEGKPSQSVFGGPAASFVPAKCVTFGRLFKVVQGAKLTLPCPTVGIPTPELTWMHGKQEVPIESRLQLLADNSLQLSTIQSTDAGNYSCQVKNEFGDDIVHHVVVVQVPPAPPSVSVIMATLNSVGLRWKMRAHGDSPILGYILKYKPEFGSWESIELQPYQESHTLRNLRCGTTYEMTISAINEVGMGEASEVLTVATDGGAPVAPAMAKLIEESTNHMTLHLDSWFTNSCPILYFTVEYRARQADGWTLVTKGVKPNQRMQIVPELVPGTWYTLRMTAHSTAGTTVAEYDFSTLMDDRGGNFINDDVKETSPVFTLMDLGIIGPIIACALVIIICLVVTCLWVRRRRRQQEAQSKARTPAETSLSRRSEATHSTLTSLRRSTAARASTADSEDDISPYAMVRLSDFQEGTSRSAGNSSLPSLPRHQVTGWHQSHQPVPYHHAPTAPPMSETYGIGGVYPIGMMMNAAGKGGNPQLQAYAQPQKGGKKIATGSLPSKIPDQPSKSAETTFVFPPAPDGDYDPPPEFKWPFSKQGN